MQQLDEYEDGDHDCSGCGKHYCDCTAESDVHCMHCEECQFDHDDDMKFDEMTRSWEMV
jgi:hypothetical protein